MTYRFRPWQELGWSVAVAGATVLLIELVGLHPEAIKDVQAWAVALGAGMVRSMAGAALDWIRRSLAEPEPTLADQIIALSKTDRAALLIEIERSLRAERQGQNP